MATKKEEIINIEESLRPWLPRENEMGRVISATAEASSTLKNDIEEVQQGLWIQEAETINEVENIAEPFGLVKSEVESFEEFRRRVLKTFQNITNRGTPQDILNLVSSLLDIDEDNIRLENIDGPTFIIYAPSNSINEIFATKSAVIQILLDATEASYGIEIIETGDLEYITPTEYDAGSWDNDGYADLDADGNVVGGATYSGYYEDDE